MTSCSSIITTRATRTVESTFAAGPVVATGAVSSGCALAVNPPFGFGLQGSH